jgi:homogentisate 1,2-dioxygenase
LFYVESFAPFYTQNAIKRVGTTFRALLLRARFYFANELETHDEKVIFNQNQSMMHEVVYATHPFDVIGWDGYNFPYGFSIHNFEPITGAYISRHQFIKFRDTSL